MNTETIKPACLRVLGAVLALPRPVTVMGIIQHLGFRSKNAIKQHLDRLREAGLVTWDDGKHGTLRATCRVCTCTVIAMGWQQTADIGEMARKERP